jgi:predicted nucleic acid-binding Zn ribbon protein
MSNLNPYTFRKSDSVSIGDALQQLIETLKIEQKMNQTRLVAHWESLMGKTIGSRTEKLFIKDHRLFVKLTSPALKHQLTLSKSKIIATINHKLGKNVILDVVFL